MNEQKMISQPIQAYLTQIFCRCSAVKMRMYIQNIEIIRSMFLILVFILCLYLNVDLVHH